MINSKEKAFTLVELIVVITILAILGTIAFISLQGYSANARDSVRISNLTNMSKGLALIIVKDGTLPTPGGNTTNITISGSTIMTQGEMTQTMAEQNLKMSGDITDSVDGTNPIYTLSADGKKYQVAMFLEQASLANTHITNTHAADGKTFTTRGNKLGIVLTDNETPVNQQTTLPASLELTTTSTNHKVYLDDNEVIEGSGTALTSINPTASCKRILETGGARSANGGDGTYTINPAGTDFQVYCDMTTEGGGWTRVHFEDYESPVTGWSGTNTITSCGSFGNILGGYNVISTTANNKTINLLNINYSKARVKLDYLAIDSWDAGELAKVSVDGIEYFSELRFYTTGKVECGAPTTGWLDHKMEVDFMFDNNDNDIDLSISSTINSAPTDESYGIDNLEVFVK